MVAGSLWVGTVRLILSILRLEMASTLFVISADHQRMPLSTVKTGVSQVINSQARGGMRRRRPWVMARYSLHLGA